MVGTNKGFSCCIRQKSLDRPKQISKPLGLSYNESLKYEVGFYRLALVPVYPGENLEGLEKRSTIKSEQSN